MNLKGFTAGFLVIAPLTFVVSVVVSYLYSLLAHGTGIVDWDSSFRFGIIFGIVFPAMREFENKKSS